ncbi:TRAP transporter substrate-binding protein [Treponema brennaborense]|uniref:TRAP dicarboxylate transporter, DctP subunit n=1 Tax=Treponema brennaborense (strain DSM 12168 / CIP 105900 / DD5/3) TaxID=906968 RepID=F4LIB5_TREBD|nr:TRAP transporter substrate-binding protein [Treponema brennaborense]AEE16156.1 TRAP dicarboxylate transporter, DctP subunit [Treponema brennaborense DSM 12168]
MKKIIFTLLALSVLGGTVFASGSGDKGSKTMVLRYAENQPQDYPTTQAAYKFAELVEQRTDGRIKVEVYYGAQLGDEKSVIEQLQFGAIDFTRVSLSPLAEFSKALNVLQLPYLYRDPEHMWKVLDGSIGDTFLKSVESNNLIGLSWFDAGARNFYNSVRPVTSLADMKGLKIRVQESQQMMDMVQALGANPTPMAYGEVYSGLQTGVIDGAENNWPSYESTSHFEVAKYFVLDEHTRVPEMQMISALTWKKLSAEDQKIIREAALESAKIERELWAAKENASEAKVKAGGAVVTELSAAEKQKFQDAMAPLYKKYGAGYESVIADIQAIK